MKSIRQFAPQLPKFLASVLLLATAATVCSATACLADAAHDPYTVSFQAGQNGIGGTEVMNLVAHEGKLFAGTGFWEDTQPYAGPQILVLDSPTGQWHVETTFKRKLADGTPLYRRVAALQEVTFRYNGEGHPLAAPVSLLLAANDTYSQPGEQKETKADVCIFTRDDSSGTWISTTLPIKSSGIRSFGFYHDPTTNADYVFAGTNGSSFVRGVYSKTLPGKISWDPSQEGANPTVSGRIMSFCQFENTLYAATKPILYKYTNCATPWQYVDTYSVSASPHVSGLRGLTVMDGKMVGVVEDQNAGCSVLDFLPQTTELNIPSFLKSTLGTDFLVKGATGGGTDIIGAFNNIPEATNPETGKHVWLVGLGFSQSRICPIPGKQYSSWFLGRTAAGKWTVHEIPNLGGWQDPEPSPPSVRTIAVSPFAQDQGQALYIGFYDTHLNPCHNTAHIYRVGLSTALRPVNMAAPCSGK